MRDDNEYNEIFQKRKIHDRWETAYRTSGLQNRFNDMIMKRVVRWLDIPPEGRVLDAGCGTGEHTFRLAEMGYNCLGIDLSRDIISRAKEKSKELGLDSKIEFIPLGLEEIHSLGESFDAIHCRGVLMHIPHYRPALDELCAALKTGGRIAILENNDRSVETYMLRAARCVHKSKTRMVATPDGLEFHSTVDSSMPLNRIANVSALRSAMKENGVTPLKNLATEFWDINLFPAGLVRNTGILFNLSWFSLHLPARLSMANAIIGKKTQ